MSNSRIIQDWFEYSIDHRHRMLYLSGGSSDDNEVDHKMAEVAIKGLVSLDAASDKNITLFINTPGGSVEDGMAIYDCIRSCRSHVTGIVLGRAHSMGSIILQACDWRVMGAHASLLIHRGSWYIENNVKEALAQIEYDRRLFERVDNLLLQRIRAKHPRFPKARFTQLLSTDTYLDSDQAIELGLADEKL